MLYVIAGAALTPFHGDESTQVYMSRDYAYQFLQRDLNLVTFHDPPLSAQEQDLRLLNGTLNKYLIGLAWHLGGFTLADINEQWDWGGSWDYNQSTNHAPTPALLNVARLPSAILLALGVPVMVNAGCPVTAEHALQSQGGLIFSSYSQFVRALDTLVTQPEARATLGHSGKQYVSARYNWDAVMQRMETALGVWLNGT